MKITTAIALCAVATIALVGCQPWYRDDELRALRASDSRRSSDLWAEGDQALQAGHAAQAERLFAAAVERSSPRDATMYLRWARAQHAAGQRVLSRATARFALTLPEGAAGSHDQVRRFLVGIYAQDRLVGRALDWVSPATLASAVTVPELQESLVLLADAERLASTHRTQARALSRYAEWLAAYGEPDHPLLRASRARILAAVAPLTTAWTEQAAQLSRAGESQEAIHRYALAYRYQTDETFAAVQGDFGRACAAVDHPESHSPLASSEARIGDGALAADDLGAAILHYRRAVTAAPCWALAHRNLALLLAQAELRDEAGRQMDWFQRLTAARSAIATQRASTPEDDQALRRSWAQLTALPEAPARLPSVEYSRQAKSRTRLRQAGIALLAVGGIAGGVAALFGYLGADVNRQIQAGNLATLGDLNSLYASGQRDNQIAIGTAVGAGALGAIGLPLLILGLREPAVRLSFTPSATPSWARSDSP